MITVEINEDIYCSQLMFNKPIQYADEIKIYPVRMENVIEFQSNIQSLIIRKDSIFHKKDILKMNYLDFLFHCSGNIELSMEYKLEFLPLWYSLAFNLLKMVCVDQEVLVGSDKGAFQINGKLLSPEEFDDIRRIIIIQNDVDFNIDEFINYDTELKLKQAQNILNEQNKEKAMIEDYIDSLAIALKLTDEEIQQLSIRKFWRYIKRINMHDDYSTCKAAAMSGMVTFKDPIHHWMTSIEKKDQFANVKADEQEIRGKVE